MKTWSARSEWRALDTNGHGGGGTSFRGEFLVGLATNIRFASASGISLHL
jgi:hypothetical protein